MYTSAGWVGGYYIIQLINKSTGHTKMQTGQEAIFLKWSHHAEYKAALSTVAGACYRESM